MRIALDATPLTAPPGGTRRYVTELARALARRFPDDEIHLLTDQRGWSAGAELTGLENVVVSPPAGPSFGDKWWSAGLPWELARRRIDVFHGTDFSIPYLPAVPSVLTFHDLSPWKDRPLRPAGSERVRRRAPKLLAAAALILTPSEAIRSELAERFGVSLRRIVAVPHGVSAEFAPADEKKTGETLEKWGIQQPYILFLGRRDERKNVNVLIEAWRRSKNRLPGLSLVLAGAPNPRGERLAAEPDLHVLHPVSDEQARALLSGAAAFVYPSLYEGFGLPVLEAMRAGAPVIASQDPALVEAAGGAALHVDARFAEGLAEAIVKAAGDARVGRELRERGFARVRGMSWRTAAERTREAYERAIRRF